MDKWSSMVEEIRKDNWIIAGRFVQGTVCIFTIGVLLTVAILLIVGHV